MEQPGGRTPKSLIITWFTISSLATVGLGAALLAAYFLWTTSGRTSSHDVSLYVAVITAGSAVLGAAITQIVRAYRDANDEAQARQRVRQAEDKLSDALRAEEFVVVPGVFSTDAEGDTTPNLNAEIDGHLNDLIAGVEAFERKQSTRAQLATERREDRLTLAALWDVTHSRMELYHDIVTGQAKRSFIAAQAAMGIGFVLLVVFAVLAAEAKTTAAAIGAGGLGAVGAAFSGYIARTFIRSQESAASHLRAYFDQPLELSRYLAAERLLADAKELTPEQRAAIVSSLVQSIATAGQGDKAKDGKPTGRQPRGRASR